MKYRIVEINSGFSIIYLVQKRYLYIIWITTHENPFDGFDVAERYLEKLKAPVLKKIYYKK